MSNRDTHVALWHPWIDKPGLRHELCLYDDFNFQSVEQIIDTIGESKYAFCQDILNPREIPSDLLLDKRTEPYLSRTGNVSALRIKRKRKNGFLIPGVQWGSIYPDSDLLDAMHTVFSYFNMEAITPSSLSEKILRRTLPEKTFISRPSIPLRNSLLKNGKGGRIQSRNGKYEQAYEYDINKAYLSIASKGVPTPFVSPLRFSGSSVWRQYTTGWMEASLTAHGKGLQPIQIIGEDKFLREPFDNETFTTWLWKGELEDCLEAGYTLHEVSQGYCWPVLSYFMEQWAEQLWNAYQEIDNEQARDILKIMMVGLPGRFLKQPEIYELVHKSELTEEDKKSDRVQAILKNDWSKGEFPCTDWYMRIDKESEKAIESAQLTPIGSYIVAETRRKIYHDSKRQEQSGCIVIRLYVDSFSTDRQAIIDNQGSGKGEYKQKVYKQVKIRHNRFYGVLVETGKEELKAPGIPLKDSVTREKLKGLEQWQDSS